MKHIILQIQDDTVEIDVSEKLVSPDNHVRWISHTIMPTGLAEKRKEFLDYLGSDNFRMDSDETKINETKIDNELIAAMRHDLQYVGSCMTCKNKRKCVTDDRKCQLTDGLEWAWRGLSVEAQSDRRWEKEHMPEVKCH